MSRKREKRPTAHDWWAKAQELERADRLVDAENEIRNGVPHLYFAAQIAELYKQRMHRMRAAGEHEQADAARSEARSWIEFYAGLATSGGEGAALSHERDRFLSELEGSSHA